MFNVKKRYTSMQSYTCVKFDKTRKEMTKQFQIASKNFPLTFTFTERSIPSFAMYFIGVIINTVRSEC